MLEEASWIHTVLIQDPQGHLEKKKSKKSLDLKNLNKKLKAQGSVTSMCVVEQRKEESTGISCHWQHWGMYNSQYV